ncbi:HAMP domain-containing sensor histidine kinase, partial [Lamprobacter modestohalophilus]|uniref:HAMP domain-containing sensor histidine kinase n=1 Tax=Lamprobacter modestohalophilus TaxID=1064514 RepID=UPI002ADEB0CB
IGSVVTWWIAGTVESAGTAGISETAGSAGTVGAVENNKQSDADEVRFSVHNTGEPIPAERLPRLTEPFFSTKASGTGLGLAIVARLVEQHGGRLSIRSTAAQGTSVEVVLPHWVDETDGTAADPEP